MVIHKNGQLSLFEVMSKTDTIEELSTKLKKTVEFFEGKEVNGLKLLRKIEVKKIKEIM